MRAAELDHRAGARARFRLIAGLILLIAAVIMLQAAALWFRQPDGRAVSPGLSAAIRSDAASPSIGSRTSGVPVVVVFADYQCAVCRADHDDIMKAVASGQRVRVIFKEWAILGERSRTAARLALAARYQGRYIEFRDALMRRGVARDMTGFEASARSAGVDWTVLSGDLRAHAGDIDEELARVSRQSLGLGLRGTPAYLIGNTLIEGRLSGRHLKKLIEADRTAGQSGI